MKFRGKKSVHDAKNTLLQYFIILLICDAGKTEQMRISIEIVIGITCIYAILVQLLRIIWLYFPSFIRNSRLYKMKDPVKMEMLLYFLVAIAVMSYFIFITTEKMILTGE